MKVQMRDQQPQIVNDILQAFRSGTKVVVLNAPTGVGKSIINMVATKEMGTGYTTTPLRTLVDQYRDTILKFDEDELGWVVMGRGGYPCPHLINKENNRFRKMSIYEKDEKAIKKHEYRVKNATADGAPCTEEKPRYLVGEGEGTFGDKMQFSKTCPFRNECPYYKDRDKARVSQNAVSTFDYFMYGIYNQIKRSNDEDSDLDEELSDEKWMPRDVLVIDEAHSLPNKLVDFFTISVTERTLPGFQRDLLMKKIEDGKKNLKPGENFSVFVSNEFRSMLIDYMNLQQAEMDQLKSLEGEQEVEIYYKDKLMPVEEALQKHKKLMYKLKFLKVTVSSDIEFVYHSDNDGIYLKPFTAKAYVQPLWEMFDHILLSSATFFNVPLYLDDLGLSGYEWKLMDVPSPFNAENGPIMREGTLYLSRKNFDSTILKVVEKVDGIMEKHKNERGIVHCFSSAYRSAIMTYSKNKDRIITHDSFNRSEVLKNFTTNIPEGDNKVLISVNMGEGVDLKDDIARFQIIVKAPFLPIGDPWIALHKERSDSWYKAQTIIELMQMAGRVVRSKEDFGYTYIIDNNAWTLLEQNRKLLPSWFTERMDAGEIIRKKMADAQMDKLLNDL